VSTLCTASLSKCFKGYRFHVKLRTYSSKSFCSQCRDTSCQQVTTQQRWADIDFVTPEPHPNKFLHIQIQSFSENFRNLVSDIQPYPIATLAKYATNSQWLYVHQWTLIFENLFIRRLQHDTNPLQVWRRLHYAWKKRNKPKSNTSNLTPKPKPQISYQKVENVWKNK